MKKALAYAAIAALLGFAVMMLPFTIQTGSQTQFMNAPSEEGATKGTDSSALQFYGIARQPTSLLPSSLIFFSGLITALGVYAMLKRRFS